MCIGNKETLETLRDNGVHYAAIEDRDFYVSLQSGVVYDKKTNDEREKNPFTVGLAIDRVWQEYIKNEDAWDEDEEETFTPLTKIYVVRDITQEGLDQIQGFFETRSAAQDEAAFSGGEVVVFTPRGQ